MRLLTLTGSEESYNYPTQAMIISGLIGDTTYTYCVVLNNTVNLMKVGEPVCGSFTTQKIISKANDDSKYIKA